MSHQGVRITLGIACAAVLAALAATAVLRGGGDTALPAPTKLLAPANPPAPTALPAMPQQSTPEPVKLLEGTALAAAQRSLPGVVELPGGRRIDIAFKPTPTTALHLPPNSGKFADDYSNLRNWATLGNADAATELHLLLERCQLAFSTEAELQGAVALLKRNRLLTYPQRRKPPIQLPPQADLEVSAQQLLITPYNHCQGSTPAQLAESGTWLMVAVSQDNLRARQIHAMKLGDTPQAISAWRQLWHAGHATSLQPLQILHSRGAADPIRRRPDYLHAYAYTLIELKLREAAATADPVNVHAMQIRSLRELLSHHERFLNPAQVQQAIELGARLLQDNANCCFVAW